MAWIDAVSEAELAAKGKLVIRAQGRQILVLATERGIIACPNRCPHEGYPLSDGPTVTGSGSKIAFIDGPEGYEIELIEKKK